MLIIDFSDLPTFSFPQWSKYSVDEFVKAGDSHSASVLFVNLVVDCYYSVMCYFCLVPCWLHWVIDIFDWVVGRYYLMIGWLIVVVCWFGGVIGWCFLIVLLSVAVIDGYYPIVSNYVEVVGGTVRVVYGYSVILSVLRLIICGCFTVEGISEWFIGEILWVTYTSHRFHGLLFPIENICPKSIEFCLWFELLLCFFLLSVIYIVG